MSDGLPQRIEELRSAVYPSFALLAGMQLDLFTQLEASPLTAKQLAAATHTDASRLRVLLYALVNAGLLTVEGDCFANTAEAEGYLVRGRQGQHAGAASLVVGAVAGSGSHCGFHPRRPAARPQGLREHASFGVALFRQWFASQRHG